MKEIMNKSEKKAKSSQAKHKQKGHLMKRGKNVKIVKSNHGKSSKLKYFTKRKEGTTASPVQAKNSKKRKRKETENEDCHVAKVSRISTSSETNGMESSLEQSKKDMPPSVSAPAKSSKFKVNNHKSTPEKQDWTEYKKKVKVQRKVRKNRTPFLESISKAKQLWEKLRIKKISDEERIKLCNQIYEPLKGNLKKVVFSHATSRLVQCVLKHGSEEIKNNFLDELTSLVPEMLQSKYASHCVDSMLKYGKGTHKRPIISSLYGHVVKLATDRMSASYLNHIYVNWATGAEKNLLRQEFYGDVYKNDKSNEEVCIKTISETTPTLKNAILGVLKTHLTKIFEKEIMKTSLVHSVLLDFVRNCSKQDQSEINAEVQNQFQDVIGSRDGVQVATLCISQSSARAKKTMLKALKGKVMETAKSEAGHLLLLAFFDTVDDTVLLNKMLMPELLGDLLGLAENEYGRKVILHLVAHNDPGYFHPCDLEILKEAQALSVSKKDMNMRISEIREAILTPLVEAITNDLQNWMRSDSIKMVTLAVLKCVPDSLADSTFEAVADYVCDVNEKVVDKGEEVLRVEHSGTHMLIKKLIAHDAERKEKFFSSVFTSKLKPETISKWLETNRGCFTLLMLYESKVSGVSNTVCENLSRYRGIEKNQESPGARLLWKKILNQKLVEN